MTFQVFLSEKAQHDLDAFSDKIANQILADCARLAGDYGVVFKRFKSRIDIVRVLSKPDFQKAY